MAQLSTDIVDWLLDSDGDIVIGRDVAWTSGLAAVVQSCRIAVQMIRAEWFLDEDEGVPLFQRPGVSAADALLGGPYNSLKVIAAYRDALLRVPHVISILSLQASLDKATRRARVTWSVRTTFGDTVPETVGPGAI